MTNFCVCLVVFFFTLHQGHLNELSPNRSTWATDFIGTLYSFTYCGDGGPKWTIYLSNGINDSSQYVSVDNDWILAMPFEHDGFSSSVEWNNTCVTSKFKVTIPLNETMNQSVLEIGFGITGTHMSTNIFVQDCATFLVDNLTVEYFTSPDYKSTGNFSCSNNGELFYSNETRLINRNTTCLESAEWEGQAGLQCWSAPLVNLTTNSTSNKGLEGEILILSCIYENIIPYGNSSVFYIGSNATTEPKDTSFKLTLKRKHNGVNVSCQADTPYTQIYNNTGKSKAITLQVFYGPNGASVDFNTTRLQFTQYNDSTILLNLSQTVEFTCISDANPLANCTWMFNQTPISSSCSTNYSIDQTGLVSCNAENLYGKTASTPLEIVVVAQRTPAISNSGNTTIIEGQSLDLGCSIAYQAELATTFTWITPDESNPNSSQLHFNAITRNNSGEYTCLTNDNFGSYFASFILDVYYAPKSADESVTTCLWKEVRNGTCFFSFVSNPTTTDYSLWNAGLLIECSTCFFQDTHELQRFFLVLEATDREEEYLLEITSNEFPNNPLTTTFQIQSGKSEVTNSKVLVIATSVVGAVLFILILFGGVYGYRRYYSPNNRSQSSGRNEINGIDNNAIIPEDNYAAVDLCKKNENTIVKEEVINPIYGRSDDITKSESTKTKQDRVKRLYVSNVTTKVSETYAEVKKIPKTRSDKRQNNSPEHSSNISSEVETYAVVDKTKKGLKINEKEEKQNPLYGSYVADLHSNTSSTNHKKERINPLYSTSYETSEFYEDSSTQDNPGTKPPVKPPIKKKPVLTPKKFSNT